MKIARVYIEYGVNSLDLPFDYLCEEEVAKGVRVIVDFNNKELIGYVEEIVETPLTIAEYEKENNFTLSKIKKVIDEKPLLNEELIQVAKFLAKETFSPMISCYQTLLPSSLKPTSGNKVKIKTQKFVKVNGDYDPTDLTVKQKEVYDMIYQQKEVAKSSIKSSLLGLINKDKIVSFDKEVYRNPYDFTYELKSGPSLSEEQAKVINEFKTSNDSVYLLEGVTGSGKTEVYINLAEYYLSLNKSVIILVPEISLTPLMIKRFKERLNTEIALFHSGLSDGERYDEYRRIINNKVKVVIGVRSAIFTPVENIGLIILDEEHSESYKQDKTPSYHTRNVAIFRASYYRGKVLLGSATPSLESKARANKGVYHLLKLTKRINKYPLPKVEIVNMIEELKKGNFSLFSTLLKTKIQERLDKKEQVMLLLNRRGYSSYVECRNCHEVVKCPSCLIPLTYHKHDKRLKCHYCNFEMEYPTSCEKCRNNTFINIGSGTQKIEETLVKTFPQSKVGRMDYDSVGINKNYDEILRKFENKEYDILLGTQMIAKGLDFANVTLVGVINADIGLNLPSYRASENIFQLLTQVVGRSGRSDKEGIAIIQTNNPTNMSIIHAANHDYEKFYQEEMEYRRSRKYPPYRFLISLMISAKKIDQAYEALDMIKKYLLDAKIKDVEVLGPSQPYVAKMGLFYRMKLLIKYKDKKMIRPYIEEIISIIKMNNRLKLTINVEPLDDV